MLASVKKALRISENIEVYDDELTSLISAALIDLGIAGVIAPSGYDDIVKAAVVTYCKLNFGVVEPSIYSRLKASYDEQKAQLVTATGYTDWRSDNV